VIENRIVNHLTVSEQKNMAGNKATLSEEQLYALEAHLAGTLTRVSPPIEVVKRLRERIHFPQRREIVLRFSDWRQMFLVFGGVMSGLLALITLGRALYYLVGRRQV
jgi:hypothetical protein